MASVLTALIVFGNVVVYLWADQRFRPSMSGPLAVAVQNFNSNEAKLFCLHGELVLDHADLDDLSRGFIFSSSSIHCLRGGVFSLAL
jgi:hypothetical protein